MPGFDGTGPRGMGPMTGGGRGFCAVLLPVTWPAFVRRGAYPAYGLPWGMPYYGADPNMPGAVPFAPKTSRRQELIFLKNQAQAMREQLQNIETRIQQLGSKT